MSVVTMDNTVKNLKRVYQYGKKYGKNVFIFTFVSLIFVVINIISPIVGARQLVYLSTNIYDQLFYATLIILGIDFISACNHWILKRNTQVFFRGTAKNIQIAVSKEILKIELSDMDKTTTGTFIQRIGGDTDEMSHVFTRGMGYLTNILTDIGVFVAVFIIDKVVFCFYLLASILLTLLHLYKVERVNQEDKKYRHQRERTSGLISELVRGVRDIKMLNAKDSFIEEVEVNVDNLSTSQFRMRNVEANFEFVISVVNAIVQVLLISLLIYLMKSSSITVATALVLYNYKGRVLSNLITHVGNLLTELKSFNLSANRVFSLLDNKEFKKEKFGKLKLPEVKGDLEFKNVYFGYDDRDVLKDMSFKIKSNETVAFVGKSGVGKTTIFSLLCKLYNVKTGDIFIDGKNINDLDEDSIRNNITIISQNPYIFNMSIKDNLRLVKENLTDEEMINACHLACLDSFISNLPDGYNTIVGEGGVTLSGGQRQRLAIARAFVQDTKIILFDEATSALDNETQSNIQKAINNMKDRYTILIIAHRLSTIVNSDRIMLVEDGKITASGTHKELLANNKNYKKLYENEILEQE